MVLINSKKMYETKNLTGKGKYIIKVVDQSHIKQAYKLKTKLVKLTKITRIN